MSRHPVLLPLASLLLVAVVGCGSVPGAATKPASRPPVDEPGSMSDADALRAALARALESAGPWPTLHIASECQTEAGRSVVEVFGNGVAIWSNRLQFELSPEEIRAVLDSFQKADFPSLQNVYGRRSEPEPSADPGVGPGAAGAEYATVMICGMTLTLEGLSKEVTQLAKGEQSPVLEALANDIFAIGEKAAALGVGARDLGDGLLRISSGDLAPETLRVLLHRKPSGRAAQTRGGFLLRVERSRASSRAYEPDGRDRGPKVLPLAAFEVALLAEDLAHLDPAALPGNLWAEDYTDLAVSVLDHRKSVQARKFAGMTRTTHGERQSDFDRIYARLEALHKRVLEQGEPEHGNSLVQSSTGSR